MIEKSVDCWGIKTFREKNNEIEEKGVCFYIMYVSFHVVTSLLLLWISIIYDKSTVNFHYEKKIGSTLNVYFGCLSCEWVDNPVICLCTIKMLCVYNVHNRWMVSLIR